MDDTSFCRHYDQIPLTPDNDIEAEQESIAASSGANLNAAVEWYETLRNSLGATQLGFFDNQVSFAFATNNFTSTVSLRSLIENV